MYNGRKLCFVFAVDYCWCDLLRHLSNYAFLYFKAIRGDLILSEFTEITVWYWLCIYAVRNIDEIKLLFFHWNVVSPGMYSAQLMQQLLWMMTVVIIFKCVSVICNYMLAICYDFNMQLISRIRLSLWMDHCIFHIFPKSWDSIHKPFLQQL